MNSLINLYTCFRVLTIILFAFIFSKCEQSETEIDLPTIFTFDISYVGEIPIDKKIEMELTQHFSNSNQKYEGSIERRGGSSIIHPKHSYEIDLKEDVSLATLPSDDDWILNANYIDKTFLRHVISFELFREMNSTNISPLTNYVDVTLNGNYNGLYVLMEKLDKSSLSINDEDTTAFIFKEPHLFRKSYAGIVPQKPGNFHQQTFPKINDADLSPFIEEVRNFILNSSDEEFTFEFSSLFDQGNIIDWHLLLLITNNSDGILKNFYLYKQDQSSPMRIAPWDYDHSFGRDGDNELNLNSRTVDIERSILFERLMKFDWYKTALKKKWEWLTSTDIISKKGLRSRIATKSQLLRSRASMNFDLWPVNGEYYYDDNDFEQEVEIINQFIDLNQQRLTAYFDF